MRLALLLAVIAALAPSASAQTPASDLGEASATPAEALAQPLAYPVQSVRATVEALFDGMRARDSSAVRAVFHPDARLFTALRTGQEGEASHRLAETPLDRFLAGIAGAPDVLDERVGPIEVRADDGLATAWMAYRFYLGDRFLHCGVNAMQLALVDGRWQIVSVVDTRRQGCE